ncbi:MAG: hypothetical protein JNN15_03740 [Blastocatellia bacterium]|nr:hypothetical protein [Blastocatellia bacterium]
MENIKSFWYEIAWFAVQTKPNQESIAALNVSRYNLEYMLPQVKQERVVYGVTRIVIRSLFSNYMFVKFEPALYLHLLQNTRGIRRVVCAGDDPIVVDQKIIDQIRKRIGNDGYVYLDKERKPSIGEKVVVNNGIFQGMVGVFEQQLNGQKRAKILLETIQARLLVDTDQIKAAAAR